MRGETIAIWRGLLKRSGARLTPARETLIQEFFDARVPLSAEVLGRALERKKVRTDRATVYRELRFLERIGLIESVRLGSRREYFERRRNHHHHAICLSCESIFDVELDETALSGVERRLQARERFTVLRHTLDFFGLCTRCQDIRPSTH
jgi:Fur family ferric uptake transcriptional regulator